MADQPSHLAETGEALDFTALFAELARLDQPERTSRLGGVDVRLVRVRGGGAGRWDAHADGPETVLVWSGTFDVAFRSETLHLRAGQCCVVPAGAEHRGTSPEGAEVILFRSAHGT